MQINYLCSQGFYYHCVFLIPGALFSEMCVSILFTGNVIGVMQFNIQQVILHRGLYSSLCTYCEQCE